MPPPGLKLEQAPPVSAPLRFFLTAPLFALLAALLIAWRGPEMFSSRWTPSLLAATHLLALGFVTMTMLGATMQILPVLAGAPLPAPLALAGFTHAALTLGTLALAGGFLYSDAALMQAAAVLLALGLGVFVFFVWFALARASSLDSALALAAVALAVAALLGSALASARGGWMSTLASRVSADLHPAWALAGWVGLLVAAVSVQVVPMFQMTPSYPPTMRRLFSTVVLMLLAAWSVLKWFAPDQVVTLVAGLALAAACILFAAVTIELQRRRRRRVADVTLWFWRAGMISTVMASLLWAARLLGLSSGEIDIALGVLAIAGAAMSLINGMLYKIVPFLAWFHLQAAGGRGVHMKMFLAEAPQRRQFALHLAALFLMTGAAWGSAGMIYAAAVCLALSAISLLWNLVSVMNSYRRAHAALNPRASR